MTTTATVRQDITADVVTLLDLHELFPMPVILDGDVGLAFRVHVLPFDVNGNRLHHSEPMLLNVTYTANGTYQIFVTYHREDQQVCHYSAAGITAAHLPNALMDLATVDDLNEVSIHHENRTL